MSFLALSGCIASTTAVATIVIPAIQYGTTAYNGYTFIQENTPHSRIDLTQDDSPADTTIQRRVIERIKMNGLLRDSDIYVFSFSGHVYLVGHYNNCEEVSVSTEIAQQVQGVRLVTTCLYPTDWENHSKKSDSALQKKLLKELGSNPQITSRRLRAIVVQKNAVLVGLTKSDAEKQQIIETTQAIKGLASVVPLLTVVMPQDQIEDNSTRIVNKM